MGSRGAEFDRIDLCAYSEDGATSFPGAKGVAMTTSSNSSGKPAVVCPYWHQVTNDFASMYPAGGYCIAGCHKRVKVMAEKTFDDVCAMNYAECEGYQRLLAEEEAKQCRGAGSVFR
jgi:hypothetical protein